MEGPKFGFHGSTRLSFRVLHRKDEESSIPSPNIKKGERLDASPFSRRVLHDKCDEGCKMNNPAAEIINLMRGKKLTLGTVESATGGLIAHLITNVPGSSDVFQGSIVSYSNEVKRKIVGV